MNVGNFLTTAITAGIFSISGISSADVVQDARTKLFDALDKESVTVNFKTGSSEVSEGELKDLKALLSSNKREGKIDRVIIAVWSDKDYPAGRGEKLSDADRKLADARSAKVKAALNKLGAATVDSYSMAEHPEWISRTFNTKEAKVKGDGKIKDADDKHASEIGAKLKDKGGPGTCVVMVRRQGDFTVN